MERFSKDSVILSEPKVQQKLLKFCIKESIKLLLMSLPLAIMNTHIEMVSKRAIFS